MGWRKFKKVGGGWEDLGLYTFGDLRGTLAGSIPAAPLDPLKALRSQLTCSTLRELASDYACFVRGRARRALMLATKSELTMTLDCIPQSAAWSSPSMRSRRQNGQETEQIPSALRKARSL